MRGLPCGRGGRPARVERARVELQERANPSKFAPPTGSPIGPLPTGTMLPVLAEILSYGSTLVCNAVNVGEYLIRTHNKLATQRTLPSNFSSRTRQSKRQEQVVGDSPYTPAAIDAWSVIGRTNNAIQIQRQPWRRGK